MSVVAGCSLLNGILLAADCRATIRRRSASDVHVDMVQKIFGVLPHTAIGFVGDVGAAGFMLYHLLIQAGRKKKNNPDDLLRWFPKYLRRSYEDYRPKGRDKGDVYFMGASVLAGEPNVIERQAIVDFMDDLRLGKMIVQTNTLPKIFFDALMLDRTYSHIEIPGASRGLLYVMRPPQFEVEHYSPLQFAAIGSGGQVIEDLHSYRNVLYSIPQGNEGNWFRHVIRGHIERHGVDTVGGLLPTFKVTARGVEVLDYKIEIPVGGTRISLAFENRRFIQKNLTTRKEIPLQFPWELDIDRIWRDNRFDDLDEAFKKFRGE